MLIESHPRSLEKRLCIVTQNAALRQVLGGLLFEWGYRLLESPSSADLLLAEEGIVLEQEDAPVLRISRSDYEEHDRLNLPLSVERLWSRLESYFHKPPRTHIRLHRTLPVEVAVRGVRTDTRIVSLSDLGTRFDYEQELVNGEEVTLMVELDEGPVTLEGRVIYVVPSRAEGKEFFQAGMIFDRTPADVLRGLREYIIRSYLEVVRQKVEPWAFREGLDLFDLPGEVAGKLRS